MRTLKRGGDRRVPVRAKARQKGRTSGKRGDREPWKKEERKEDPGKKGKGKEKK